MRETLLQALQALYHPQVQSEVRQQANKWLEDFQQSTEAWQIADSLLHDPSAKYEAHLFCSQTIRTKCQRDFEELPEGAAVSLRDSVITLLVRYREGPAPVRTQLSLALAALAVHMNLQSWAVDGEEKPNVLRWVYGKLSHDPANVNVILEFVTVLPQEGSSYKLSVLPGRRREFMKEVSGSCLDAFALLSHYLQQLKANASEKTSEQILLAFCSWLRVAGDVDPKAVMASPLVPQSFQALEHASDSVFEAAVEAVSELVILSSGGIITGMPEADFLPMVQLIVQSVLKLQPRLKASILEVKQHGGNEDLVKALARLFSEVAEAYVDLFAEGSPEGIAMAEAMLDVASIPDDTVAMYSFDFWHALMRVLRPDYESSEETATAQTRQLPAPEIERRRLLFAPAFSRLVSLISGRVQYPSDFKQWRKDQRSDFRKARYSVADTLVDAAFVAGGKETIAQLSSALHSLSSAAVRPEEWSPAEAALYCIRAIAKAVPDEESVVLPQLMQFLPSLQLQTMPPQLLYTISLTIAAYADWLGAAVRAGPGRQLLPNIVNMLCAVVSMHRRGLQHQSETEGERDLRDACEASALALKHVCDTCAVHVAPTSLQPLVDLTKQLLEREYAENVVIDRRLDGDPLIEVTEAICTLASSLEDPQQQAIGIQALCNLLVDALQRLLTRNGVQNQGALVAQIDRCAVVFQHARNAELLSQQLMTLWPVLTSILSVPSPGPDAWTVERLCRLLKHALRSVGAQGEAFVNVLATELPNLFQRLRHEALLYVATELIRGFSFSESHEPLLRQMTAALLQQAMLSLQTLDQCREQPFLADDTYLFATQVVRRSPNLIAFEEMFPKVVETAITCSLVQHKDACTSALTFLIAVMEMPLDRDASRAGISVQDLAHPLGQRILQIVNALGPQIVRAMFAGVVGGLPMNRLGYLGDTLVAVCKLAGPGCLPWIHDTLGMIPTSVMPDSDKQSIMNAFVSYTDGQLLSLTPTIEEISEVCRRNKRSCQAAQDALLAQLKP